MRDLLPPEAAARSWLSRRVTQIFETWGYEPDVEAARQAGTL